MFNQALNTDGTLTGVSIAGEKARGVHIGSNVGVVAANGDVTAGGKINKNSFAGIKATTGDASGVNVDQKSCWRGSGQCV